MISLINKLKKNNILSYNFNNVKIHDFLGEGSFGKVFKCEINKKIYAAKYLNFKYP